MRTFFYYLMRSDRAEILQLFVIFLVSLLAALSGYTAVSWMPDGEHSKLLLGVMATAVTLIFCGVLTAVWVLVMPQKKAVRVQRQAIVNANAQMEL